MFSSSYLVSILLQVLFKIQLMIFEITTLKRETCKDITVGTTISL